MKFDNIGNKILEYLNKINELEKDKQALELKIKEKDRKINEENIKNGNLNKKIKEIELKIKEKDRIINEENIKNDNLNKKIKELELKIKEMDRMINEENIKNANLNKKIKELELKIEGNDKIINEENIKNENLNKNIPNISNNNLEIKKIIELENEIKLFRIYNNFSEGEKLISIKFASVEQDIDYSLTIKNTEIFSKIELMLYNKYPKYIETENYFLVGGNKINKHKSLEKNNIKDNDIITLFINNFD